MRDLIFDGVTDDGSFVVLTDDAGESYHVPLDDDLAAALAHERHASQETAVESPKDTMRPKDIQARIRAGASPEQIARETGMDLSWVERFAGPPLAERAFIVDRARRTEVRRSEGPATLDDTVELRLLAHGVDSARAEWDSRRLDDGRWHVVLTLPDSLGTASWSYDPDGRSVAPDDDTARALSGPEPSGLPLPRPRLVALREPVDDIVPEAARPAAPPAPASPAEAEVVLVERVTVETLTIETTETVEVLEVVEVVDIAEAVDVVEIPAVPAAVEPAPAARLAPVTTPAPVTTDVTDPDASDEQALRAEAEQAQEAAAAPDPSEETALPAAPAPKAPAKSRKARRASVPSWDEIVFGTRVDE